jgi:hypothetical protein
MFYGIIQSKEGNGNIKKRIKILEYTLQKLSRDKD